MRCLHPSADKICQMLMRMRSHTHTRCVPSCQQVWNKPLTTCNNLVAIIGLVARLFQQVRYSHDIAILLQPCVVKLVTFLLYHDCIMLNLLNNLVTSLIMPSSLLQVVNSLFQTCYNNREQAVRTQLVDSCEQICNNLFADL